MPTLRVDNPSPSDPDPPRLAILFWFYKEFRLCRERIELLKGLNPGQPIYGLYGGAPEDAASAASTLGDLLDDLHVYEGGDAEWRWIHGDQVIAAWHARRGGVLAWDTLVVVQWDLLMAAPLGEVLAGLRGGEAAFSGDRPLAEVAPWWGWGGVGAPHQNAALEAFRAYLQDRFGYAGALWCCLFIASALPRRYLDRFVAEGPPRPGFLEYKLPTLARIFDTPVRALPQLDTWWRSDPAARETTANQRVLNAGREAIAPEVILAELSKADGRRVFHPVYEIDDRVLSRLRERVST